MVDHRSSPLRSPPEQVPRTTGGHRREGGASEVLLELLELFGRPVQQAGVAVHDVVVACRRAALLRRRAVGPPDCRTSRRDAKGGGLLEGRFSGTG